MQRTAGNRSTRVLMVGLSGDEWMKERRSIKGALQSAHMGWSLATAAVLKVQEAVGYIKTHEDLELVVMCHDIARYSYDEMFLLSNALGEHPHKPWVHLEDPVLMPWLPVFVNAGVTVSFGFLEEVIFRRWESQIPAETVA